MKLWGIDERIRNYEMQFDEDGVWVNEDELENLEIEREQKLENLACFVKELRAEASAIATEGNTLLDRANKLYGKADGIENYISFHLAGEELKSSRVAVTFRRSERVQITDQSKIPEEYIVTRVEETTKADKTKIKKAIKAGVEIEGAYIQENLNIHID